MRESSHDRNALGSRLRGNDEDDRHSRECGNPATIATPWVPACAGMMKVNWILACAGMTKVNWVPACAGMTEVNWVPACAGMTEVNLTVLFYSPGIPGRSVAFLAKCRLHFFSVKILTRRRSRPR